VTVTQVCMTDHFVLYGTAEGHVAHYSLEGGDTANEYKHAKGITRLFPNATGAKVIFQDANQQVRRGEQEKQNSMKLSFSVLHAIYRDL
jgi:hypothetical protein